MSILNITAKVQFKFGVLWCLLISCSATGQMRKNWHSSLDSELKGNVKAWVMKNEDSVTRTQQFNSQGQLISDTYVGSSQHTTPSGAFLSTWLKEKYEVKYLKASKDSLKKTANTKFNSNGQITAITTKDRPKDHSYFNQDLPYSHKTINKFDAKGRLIQHKTYESSTEERAYNSVHHEKPTYTVTDNSQSIAFYDYNQYGELTKFEYFHSEVSRCIKVVYTYDSNHNLIEQNRYNNYNVPIKLQHNYNVKKVKGPLTKPGNSFWKHGSPAKETWAYDDLGNKTEYVVYGYMNGPSFKATWEYDSTGTLLKEIHHDVYHNTIRADITFDKQGNVIKETNYDYWAKKEYHFSYDIVYY